MHGPRRSHRGNLLVNPVPNPVLSRLTQLQWLHHRVQQYNPLHNQLCNLRSSHPCALQASQVFIHLDSRHSDRRASQVYSRIAGRRPNRLTCLLVDPQGSRADNHLCGRQRTLRRQDHPAQR